MDKTKKDVKPITARQVGELARLLEERGMDSEVFQRTLIENIDGLVFFARGKFGQFIGKTIQVQKDEHSGFILIVNFATEDNGIIGIAQTLYDYCMGNILLLHDKVFVKKCLMFPHGVYGVVNGIVKEIHPSCNFNQEIIEVEVTNFPDTNISWEKRIMVKMNDLKW